MFERMKSIDYNKLLDASYWPWLVAIIFGVFYFLLIGNHNLWTDEFITIITSQRPLGQSFTQLQDYSAPIYPLIVRLISNSLNPPEWLVRMPAWLFATLALPAIWSLAKELFNSKTAAVATLCVAMNPLFLRYTVEARAYSLFLLCSTLSVYTFWRLLRMGGMRNALAFVLSTCTLLYAHNMGFLLLPAEAAFWLLAYLSGALPRRNVKISVLAYLAVAVLSVPELWIISRFLLSGVKGTAGWPEVPRLTDMIWPRQFGELMAHQAIGAAAYFSVIAGTIWGAALKPASSTTGQEGKDGSDWWRVHGCWYLCAAWVGFGSVFVVIVSYLVYPIYDIRYVFPIMVPLSIALARMVTGIPWRYGSVCLLILALLLVGYPPRDYFRKSADFTQVVTWLESRQPPVKEVLVVNWAYCEGFINPEVRGLSYYGWPSDKTKLIELNFPDNVYVKNPGIIKPDSVNYVVSWTTWGGYKGFEKFLQETGKKYTHRSFGDLAVFMVGPDPECIGR